MCDISELMLFLAARTQHVTQIIIPGLNQNSVVVSDRFDAATYAYQVFDTERDTPEITQAMNEACSGLTPDLALIFDLDPEIGMARKFGDTLDRIEKKNLDFHRRVREGFLAYAAEREYAVVIDAGGTPNEMHRLVIEVANERLRLNLPVLEI
jgi:dTMP kinase